MRTIIENTMTFVKETFEKEYSGHDVWHTMRVYKLATNLAKEEKANLFTVQLAALLHDVDDYKLSKDTYPTKQKTRDFLKSQGLDEASIESIVHIIDQVSFKGSDSQVPDTLEGKCVQDADRLDAIGAIGIARAFTFGGHHNRVLYDPSIPPRLHMDEKTYRNHVSTTINHFYEKLFLLEKMMNTKSAKKMASHRQHVMQEYMNEFLLEWEGEK